MSVNLFLIILGLIVSGCGLKMTSNQISKKFIPDLGEAPELAIRTLLDELEN